MSQLVIELWNRKTYLQYVWGDRMVQWCWVSFQCRGVLLILIVVGQGPTALAVGAGGRCLDFFLSSTIYFYFSRSLGAGPI